jgi:hypothetical protein
MLAFYLRWSGENEWRSHPYVTPRVLRQLPIPTPWASQMAWSTALDIAESVRSLSARRDNQELDFRIERLLAELYGLDQEDCAWVATVLNEAQPLEAIRQLRVPDPALLYPNPDGHSDQPKVGVCLSTCFPIAFGTFCNDRGRPAMELQQEAFGRRD